MKKRMVGLALCLALAFSMMGSAFAYAGNSGDTSFSFSFTGSNLQQTATRAKDDYTSSWMQVTSITSGKSYVASVQARSSASSTTNISVGSPSYTFYSGTATYMTNYVKESGYNYAGIRAAQNSTGSFSASGWWSPDSV
jgi:hypothetical protein